MMTDGISNERSLLGLRIKENLKRIIDAGLLSEALQVIQDSAPLLGEDSELRTMKETVLGLLRERGEATTGGVSNPEGRPTVLVGSVVKSRPNETAEFLRSLAELDREGIEVGFLFLDDTPPPESSRLLSAFDVPGAEVAVFPADKALRAWQPTGSVAERETWRNAALKDLVLATAHDQGCDFVLLVESAVILHPKTLRQLVGLDKDIVAPIMWSRGPQGLRLPQVWLTDSEERFSRGKGEQVAVEDGLVRQFRFLEALKRPGLFEVGGAKDCLLISREAIERGTSFREIENLSFPGEYAHFCVRAAALGLPLCVDTRVAAYRQSSSDPEGAVRYRSDVRKRRGPIRKKVALVHPNPSGSSTLALKKYTPDYITDEYDIELVQPNESVEYYASLLDSDAVIVTDGSYSINKPQLKPEQLAIDLWHGFPLKAVGYEDKNQPAGLNDLLAPRWRNLDWIGSYSELYNQLMERCLRTGDPSKYRIVGMPRNDFLFRTDGRRLLEEVLGRSLAAERIVFYAPTYRSAPGSVRRNDANRNWSAIFDMPHFEAPAFERFLEENGITVVVKLHPAEEAVVAKFIGQTGKIHLITNAALAQHGVDLYETMNAADMLITDYSSVFFDYLLLGRPVMFAPTDLDQYVGNRGLLLPYDDWTPGPKVIAQPALEAEILRSLADPDYYRCERETVTAQVHQYRDGNSCDRTWEIVHQMLRERA